MLSEYNITDGCGTLSLVGANREQPYLHASRRISSGNFESLTPESESFSSYSHWPSTDVVVPDYPSDDEMTNQVKRLQTFRDWPSSCPVKPKELAAAGFYYAGVGDNVRCFRCDLTLRKWEPGDSPWEDHKRHKPHCPFVRENDSAIRYDRTTGESSSSNLLRNEQMRNVPTQSSRDVSVGNLTSEKAEQNLQSQITEVRDPGCLESFEQVSFGERIFQETRNPSGCYDLRPQRFPTACENALREDQFVPGQSNPSFRSLQVKEGVETSVNQAPSSLSLQGGGRVFKLDPGSHMSITSGGQDPVRVTPYSRYPQGQATRPEVQESRVGQPSFMLPAEMSSFTHSASLGNPSFPVQSGRTGREAKPSRFSEHAVGVASINRERPREMANVAYPVVDPTLEEGRGPLFRQEDARHVSTSADLASEHHRLTTFVDWPPDSPLRPWELSVAGFYFVGTEDRVRCFKCGVMLNNWEPDDTPWGEHQKWAPQCPLVLQHFRGRAQMGPVESTAGVPQSRHSQLYSSLPQSPIRRRSPPLMSASTIAVPGRRSSGPAMPHSTPSSRAASFRNAEAFGNPSSEVNTYSGPGSLPSQERRHFDVHVSPPAITPLSNPDELPGVSQSDVEHLVSMGFERDQVNQAICRRVTSSGRSFTSLDELVRTLLSSSSPTPSRVPADREALPSHFSSTLPALPLENEEVPSGGSVSSPNNPIPRMEGLRRTMSSPLDGFSGGAEAEKDESLQQKLDRMQEERTCKICMDAEVGVVFLPCGHLSCCPGCASGMEQCPMCRSPIYEKIRTYLS